MLYFNRKRCTIVYYTFIHYPTIKMDALIIYCISVVVKSDTDWLTPVFYKSSLTLSEWRFNLNFSWVSMLFLNSWRVSSHIVRYDTNPPAIQEQHWHSREAHIEPPLIECEWAFRIRAEDPSSAIRDRPVV
jgi:hypothetical protein